MTDNMLTHYTEAEYQKKRRHGYAGPIKDLVGPSRLRYQDVGATHWHLYMADNGMTVLGPCVVEVDR